MVISQDQASAEKSVEMERTMVSLNVMTLTHSHGTAVTRIVISSQAGIAQVVQTLSMTPASRSAETGGT
jgi:hypothetical protein